jgi:hypothetical protein
MWQNRRGGKMGRKTNILNEFDFPLTPIFKLLKLLTSVTPQKASAGSA